MTIKKRVLVWTALAGLTMSTAVGLEAQNRKNFSIVSDDGGHVALGLAIRKLSVAGTFMQAPAHPDDETNALFATFGYVMGLRVIDVQNNRGDGGQNPDRTRALPRHRRAAHRRVPARRTRSTAPSSTSRARSTTATPSRRTK